MQSSEMEAFVIDLLTKKIPPHYFYHNAAHTSYVTEKAAEIARHEGCSAKEIDLLRAAALWHDAGFINTCSNHEKASCLLARQYLPGYHYTTEEIDLICGIIMATKMPQSPQTRLQEIMADADLEYLGSVEAEEQAARLFKELQWLNPSLTTAQWHKTQVSFLQSHQYFTRFCKTQRQPLKQQYLDKLVNNIG